MPAPRFHAVTLGCKLNQFDTAAIEGELRRRGYAPLGDGGDAAAVVVVNTCTVTGRADADARKRIRQLRREHPDGVLLVTGCYAELEPETLDAMAEVDRVFGNRDKPRLAEILDELGLGATSADGPAADRGCDAAPAFGEVLHFGERSRAFLKIQEGCRLACSYCVIPRVRGASRSVPPGVVVRAATDLFRRGYRELVLTGVNTGDYGRDLEPRESLAGLLRRLLDACGPNRVRLNSLEPLTVDDAIVELLASEPRLAPHLQIPLQSGCDETLAAMRRNYRTATYLERLERLRAAVPAIGLGADVIVGFPGETRERFEASYAFVERSPLCYLHVFSWSARPGTPAASLDDRVDPREIRRRSRTMRALGERLARRFRDSLAGSEQDAVVLADDAEAAADRSLRALTGNFVEVRLPRGCAERGAPVRVRLGRTDADGTTPATPVGVPAWATVDRLRSGPSAPSPS